MKRFLLLLVVMVLYAPVCYAKVSPSFDCSKASTEVEEMVCSDDELAQLDVEMDMWYKQAKQAYKNRLDNTDPLRQQQVWLKRMTAFECFPQVDNKKECLISLYNELIKVLKNRLLRVTLEQECFDEKCTSGVIEEANKLLKSGADLNGYDRMQDECWGGAVYYTVLSQKNTTLFNFIVDQGADFTLVPRSSCKYKSPLDYYRAFDFFDEMMKINPDLDYQSHFMELAQKAISGSPSGMLCGGIENSDFAYFKKILTYDPTMIKYKDNGKTVLIKLYEHTNHNDYFRFEKLLHMTSYLIEMGIDVFHKDKDGHDVLYYLDLSRSKFTDQQYEELKDLLTTEQVTQKNDKN